MSYDEAFAKVTGPGQLFEVVEESVGRHRLPAVQERPAHPGPGLRRGPGRPESTFMVYEDERWTFDETMRHVDALAHALVHHLRRSAKGDRVGIAMRNLPEWVVSFAAILSIGAVSVSLNAWWTEAELDYAIGDSGLSLLIADPERIERAHGPAHSRGVPMIVVRADEHRAPAHRGPALRARSSPWASPMPVVEVGPDDDATILYTSGTTGFPKGAVSTHRAVTQALMAFWANATIQTARKGEDPLGGDGHRPVLHPHRAAVPRDRVRPGHAVLLRHEVEAGDDAPLGPRDRPAPHRGRAGDRLRRGAHPELGHAREPGLLPVRHLVAGHHRRGRRPGSGQAGRPGREGLHPGPAQHRLRDDRDQRLRPGQQRRRLREPPDLDRAGPDHHHGHRDPRRGRAGRSRSGPGARSG